MGGGTKATFAPPGAAEGSLKEEDPGKPLEGRAGALVMLILPSREGDEMDKRMKSSYYYSIECTAALYFHMPVAQIFYTN
jgi:hypothetical protein